MANVMYDRAKKALGLSEVQWVTGDVKASALGSGYLFDPTHTNVTELTDVLDTVDVDDRAVADTGEWSNGDLSPGPVIGSGETMTAVVFWLDSGTPSTSWLLVYQDRNSDLTPISRAGVGDPVLVPYPGNTVEFV